MEEQQSLIAARRITDKTVRVSTASDPFTFFTIISGLLASVFFADVTGLLVAVGVAGSVVAAAPYVPLLQRRAMHREQKKATRASLLRRRNTERRLLRELPPPLAERYLDLKVRVQDVPRALARAERDHVLDQVHEQLRELLMAYLRLLVALHNLDRLLIHIDEIDLYRQLDRLEHEIRTSNPRVASVKASRRDILLRRRSRIEQARESREIILTQLEMVEDIVNLLRDSTLTAPDPSMLNEQLADLMAQIEAADEAVQEVSFIHNEVRELAQFEQRVAG